MIWLTVFFSGLFLISLDQFVKYWAVVYLKPVGTINVLDGLFALSYVENRGAAFGLMEGWRWLFIPLTVVVVAGLLIYYARLPRARKYWAVRVPMMFILSGAVGNFIDRVRLAYVVDMFEFKFITFPVFNVADICLVCGTFAFAFVMIFIIKEEKPGE